MSLEKKARQNVEKKKEFKKSLGSFLSTALIFLVIMFFIPGVGRWMLFALAIWGVSIIAKGLKLYSTTSTSSEDWEEREYQKEMKRLRRLDKHNDQEYDLKDLSKKEAQPIKKENSKNYWDEDEIV